MEGTLRQTAAAAEATAVATAAALRSILPLQTLGSYTGTAKEKQPTPAFTSWPEGAKGNRVLDLEVDLPVDMLFEVLWGPSAPVAVSKKPAATIHEAIYEHSTALSTFLEFTVITGSSPQCLANVM